MKKNNTLLVLICTILINLSTFSQNINFKDFNFKKVLLKQQPTIDTNNDTEISYAEAKKVTEIIITNEKINIVDEIRYFENLTYLILKKSQIQNIDLSKNIKLTSLNLSYNTLQNIDISKNTVLTELNLVQNEIQSIDLSNNTELTKLYLGNNSIQNIDVSNNTELTELHLSQNQVQNINLSKNTELTELYISQNKIQSVNLSQCKLEKLYISNCQNLTTINLINQPLSKGLGIRNNPNLKLVCTNQNKIKEIYNKLKDNNNGDFTMSTSCEQEILNTLKGKVEFLGFDNKTKYPFEYTKFTATNTKNNTTSTFSTNQDGTYTAFLEKGDYIITPEISNVDFSEHNLYFNPESVEITFSGVNETKNQDFIVTGIAQVNELNLTIIGAKIKPGFETTYTLVCKNYHSEKMSNVKLTFDPKEDNLQSYVGSSLTPQQISNDLITWNIDNINPFETKIIEVTYKINTPTDNPPVNNGDILNYTAKIFTTFGGNPLWDTAYLRQIVGSSKPIDINVLEGKVQFKRTVNKKDYFYPFEYTKFTATNTKNNTTSTFSTNQDGTYTAFLEKGDYIITPEISNVDFSEHNLYFNPESVEITFSGVNETKNQDFIVTGKSGKYLNFTIVGEKVKPGFETTYTIVCKNYYSKEMNNVKLIFDPNEDNLQSYVGSSLTPQQISNDLITWNIDSINPFETKIIEVTYKINTPTDNPPVNNGDILNYTAKISINVGGNPLHRTAYLRQIVGSSEPININVLEGKVQFYSETDETKYPFEYTKFKAVNTKNNTTSTFSTNQDGTYTALLEKGEYIITPLISNVDFSDHNLYFNPESVEIVFNGANETKNQDFIVTGYSQEDPLNVTIVGVKIKPGFETTYTLVCKNYDSRKMSNVKLTFDPNEDNLQSYVGSSLTPQQISNDLITWNIDNINPFETKIIEVTYKINTPTDNPPVNNGDILNYTAEISKNKTVSGNPLHHKAYLRQIVGSSKPIDINVLEGKVKFYSETDETKYPFEYTKFEAVNTKNNTTSTFSTNQDGTYSTFLEKGDYIITPKISDESILNENYINVKEKLLKFDRKNVKISFEGANETKTKNFIVNGAGTGKNLEITSVVGGGTKPGFETTYTIICKNYASRKIEDIDLTFEPKEDNLQSYVSSSLTPQKTDTNLITWKINSMEPFETKIIKVTYKINTPTDNPPVNNGDIVTYVARIFTTTQVNNNYDETYIFKEKVDY